MRASRTSRRAPSRSGSDLEAKSLVFAGIYPLTGEDYPLLRDALEKLHLNDASFTYEPESSVALGFRSGGEESRLRGDLSTDRRGLPAAARRAREAAPQRCELHVRAGELRRARVPIWRRRVSSSRGSIH